MYSIVATATNHPDAVNPYWGLFNHRILKSLADAGISVDVVSPRPYAPPVGPYSAYASLPPVEEFGPYRVHHPRFWYLLPKRLLYGISGESYAKRVPQYVERTFEPPEIVHACHLYPDGYGMLPYVRKHNIPLFVVSHGKFLNDFDELPPTVAGKVQETLDAATGVLCVSDALATKARNRTDPSKVSTVPIGADPNEFPVDQQARLRRDLDIAPDATVVLFVGEFTERKGITELQTLLPELELEDTEFVFVGHGGDKKRELKQAIDDSDGSNHLYTGISSRALREWFAVADLFLLPSHAEGRPTVIYEAMASETAVLASTVGGIPEQVADGETGVLVPPGDLEALESALVSLTQNPDRLQQLGNAGIRRLRRNQWTWADHGRRVKELHMTALEDTYTVAGNPQPTS